MLNSNEKIATISFIRIRSDEKCTEHLLIQLLGRIDCWHIKSVMTFIKFALDKRDLPQSSTLWPGYFWMHDTFMIVTLMYELIINVSRLHFSVNVRIFGESTDDLIANCDLMWFSRLCRMNFCLIM